MRPVQRGTHGGPNIIIETRHESRLSLVWRRAAGDTGSKEMVSASDDARTAGGTHGETNSVHLEELEHSATNISAA